MSEISQYFGTIVDKKEKKTVKSNFLGKNREGFYFVTNVNTRFLKCTHSHTTIKITSKQGFSIRISVLSPPHPFGLALTHTQVPTPLLCTYLHSGQVCAPNILASRYEKVDFAHPKSGLY